jgi:hypothetical protein
MRRDIFTPSVMSAVPPLAEKEIAPKVAQWNERG